MKILFISHSGDSAGLAYKLYLEQTEVRMFIYKPIAKDTLKGIIDKVDSIEQGLNWKPDIIIFDMAEHGKEADRLKKLGYNVIGASAFCDRLELDRSFGANIANTVGINQPEEYTFNTLDEIQDHIIKNEGPWVLKPSGNVGPEFSYVADTDEELFRYINYLKKLPNKSTGVQFLLQKRINGIEISTEMWYSNGKRMYPANATMETKSEYPGNLGENTGCQTSVVWCFEQKTPKIIQKIHNHIELLIEKSGYTGPIDVNIIIGEKDNKPYFLEFTPRFGYSALYALCQLLNISLTEFFSNVMNGKMDMNNFDMKSFAYALRVTIPPFPVPDGGDEFIKKKRGLPVIFPTNLSPDDGTIWPLDCMLDENSEMVVCGIDGVVCEVTSKGKTIDEAKSKVIGIFDRIIIPNKKARVLDGHKSAIRDYPELISRGWFLPKKAIQ